MVIFGPYLVFPTSYLEFALALELEFALALDL